MRFSRLASVLAIATAAAACNAIFGVDPGLGSGPSGSSSTSSGVGGTTTSSGSTSSDTSTSDSTSSSSTSTGTGSCPASHVPPCHVDGGTGAMCDAIPVTAGYDGYTLGMAVIGDTIYWASGNGKITFASIDGVVDPNPFGDGNDSVMVATDGSRIFWTDWYDGKIRSASLTPPYPLLDISSMTGDGGSPNAYLGRIVHRSGMLYWAGEEPNAIWAAKADGSQIYATKVADKIDDTQSTDVSIGVAVDDAHVYWTDAGKVRRIPVDKLGDAAAIEDFASDDGAGEVVLDDTRVYWTSNAGVSSVKKDKTGLIVLPSTGSRARSLLLDGPHVYWSEAGGRIVRADRGGGPSTATAVAQGATDAYMLASDCGAIYWGTFAYNHGTIFKAKKP